MDIIGTITNAIHPGMLGVSLALWVLGYGLKATPKVPNWSIFWITVVLGVVAGILIVGPTAEGVVQGILSAAMAILVYQAVKQTGIGIEETKDEK